MYTETELLSCRLSTRHFLPEGGLQLLRQQFIQSSFCLEKLINLTPLSSKPCSLCSQIGIAQLGGQIKQKTATHGHELALICLSLNQFVFSYKKKFLSLSKLNHDYNTTLLMIVLKACLCFFSYCSCKTHFLPPYVKLSSKAISLFSNLEFSEKDQK